VLNGQCLSLMTKVGMAIPWLSGVCIYLLPSIATTRIVHGRCVRLVAWPNAAVEQVDLT